LSNSGANKSPGQKTAARGFYAPVAGPSLQKASTFHIAGTTLCYQQGERDAVQH
jgi:hypothetical protein